jgi:hypothetical protein
MNSVKLQVPINKIVRDKLEVRAKNLGFDSAQAYVRFWAKAETENRHVDFGYDSWGEPSDAAVARLNAAAKQAKKDLKAGKLKAYTNTKDFMRDLVREAD